VEPREEEGEEDVFYFICFRKIEGNESDIII
jgi:hypothetical protein